MAAKEGGKRTRPRTTVEHGKILVTADKDAVGQGGERGEERGEAQAKGTVTGWRGC